MEALQNLKARRTVRKFTTEAVSDELLKEIVEYATYAPTWKNSQTVRYYAIKNEEVKNRIADEAVMGFTWNTGIIKGAPVLMVVATVDKRSGFERDGSFSTSKGTHWQSFDAGLATENLILAAYEKGLGSVIMGIYDEKAVADIVALPEGQSVSALVAIGFPAEEPKMPPRKSVDEVLTIM